MRPVAKLLARNILGGLTGASFFLGFPYSFFRTRLEIHREDKRKTSYGRAVRGDLKIRSFMTSPASAALASWDVFGFAVLSFHTPRSRRIFLVNSLSWAPGTLSVTYALRSVRHTRKLPEALRIIKSKPHPFSC